MKHMLGITMNCNLNKNELLTILKRNRENHKEMFETAKKGYFEKAKKVLNDKLIELDKNKMVNVNVSLVVPKHFISEYDTVIEMLEMHIEKNMQLSADEFRMFVQDQWDWKEAFLSLTSQYCS